MPKKSTTVIEEEVKVEDTKEVVKEVIPTIAVITNMTNQLVPTYLADELSDRTVQYNLGPNEVLEIEVERLTSDIIRLSIESIINLEYK